MYNGIKSILKLINHTCNSHNGCCEKCPVYNECKREDWELLRNDLGELGIEENEVDLPTD